MEGNENWGSIRKCSAHLLQLGHKARSQANSFPSLSSTTLWLQPQLLGTSNKSPLIFAKVGVGGMRGVGSAGRSMW